MQGKTLPFPWTAWDEVADPVPITPHYLNVSHGQGRSSSTCTQSLEMHIDASLSSILILTGVLPVAPVMTFRANALSSELFGVSPQPTSVWNSSWVSAGSWPCHPWRFQASCFVDRPRFRLVLCFLTFRFRLCIFGRKRCCGFLRSVSSSILHMESFPFNGKQYFHKSW